MRIARRRLHPKIASVALVATAATVGVLGFAPAAVASTTAGQLAPPSYAHAAASSDWVATPAGLAYKSCVHKVPNGATVLADGAVVADGVTSQVPACPYSGVVSYPAVTSPSCSWRRRRGTPTPWRSCRRSSRTPTEGTDRPADLTVAQWAQRRQFWDRVFPTGRYGDARRQWNLRTTFDDGLDRIACERADVASASAPSRRTRAERLVRDGVLVRVGANGTLEQMIRHIGAVRAQIADGLLDDALAAADPLLADIATAVLDGTAAATVDDGQARRMRFAELAQAGASRLCAEASR